MQRFLIIQTAFLGDVILATPVLSELKRIYPGAQIDVVVRKGNESLLFQNPAVHQLFIWDKKNQKYKKLVQLIKKIRTTRYDEVITLQRYSSAGIITYFTHSKQKIGFHKNSFKWMYDRTVDHSLLSGEHEVTRNLKTIAHHGAKDLIRPSLFPSNTDYKHIKPLIKEDYYCLAPASVWETKKLPKQKWIALIGYLAPKGTVFLIGGPDDIALCEEIGKESGNQVQVLAGQLSLLQSAALMKSAERNYVNDSGPLHIASAMNAPTTAFFCSTVPRFGFGPLADDSKIVETQKELDCRPCTFHGRRECPLGHYDCGHTIEINSKT